MSKTQDVTVLDTPAPANLTSQVTMVEQARAVAEVQAAVVVAQSNPRDNAAAWRAMEEVCSRLAMAEKAFYAVQNRGRGPSVHLARELARVWGNIQYGVHELHRDDKAGMSEVQAFAWDVQVNSRSTRTFLVPHQRMARGKRQDLVDLQDVYLNNQNVGARAVRETILSILPLPFVARAQEVCQETLRNGEGKPVAQRAADAIGSFARLGVTEAMLADRVGRGRAGWDGEDLAELSVLYQSIRAGEVRVEDEFQPSAEAAGDALIAGIPTEEPPA